MQLTFNDSGVVTSASLPAGSPVTMHLTIASQAFSIYIGRPKGHDSNGGTDDAYGGIYLNVFDENSRITFSPFNGAGTIKTYDFNTTVGSRLNVSTEFDLNAGAFAGKDGNLQFSPFYPEVQGAINASHTTKFFVDGPAGVSFAADSGHSYALQPHPPAIVPASIAATGATSIPGGSGAFTSFTGHAALSGASSAFFGSGSGGQQGIYLGPQSPPIKVADLNTAIPGGTGNFIGFGIGAIPGEPCVSGDNVAFYGAGSGGQQGIYWASPSGPPTRVADSNTTIPGGTGNYTGFSVSGIPVDPCISGDNVAFYGAGSAGQKGIYRALPDAPPIKVADLNTAIPAGTGNFTGFVLNGIPTDPCMSGDTVAFFGTGSSGQQGVYRAASSGPPIKVADLNTAVPAGTGNFTSFKLLALDPSDASNLALVGSGTNVVGVYASIAGGPLARIADTSMQFPGSTSTFADFGAVSIDPGDVAFLAFGSSGEKGIFANVAGQLVDVVNVEDTIAGKLIADLDFGPFGFSEASGTPKVTYRATFSDGSSSILTATLNQPISGDFNGDGTVNAADYVVWRKGLGTIYTQSDYNDWRAHFGQSAGSGAGASVNTAVPEPTTLVLLLMGILAFTVDARQSHNLVPLPDMP
jgi:hypothetical protein